MIGAFRQRVSGCTSMIAVSSLARERLVGFESGDTHSRVLSGYSHHMFLFAVRKAGKDANDLKVFTCHHCFVL